MKADTILTGGRVFISASEDLAEAVALWGGKVLATGSAAAIDALRGPSTRVIDLSGRLATPGLYEAHLHLLPLGLMMGDVDVGRGTRGRSTRSCASSRRGSTGRSPANGFWPGDTTSSNLT